MTSSVIMPMENALSGIAGIDQMRRTSTPAAPPTSPIRFLLEADLDDAANTVREKVAGAMRAVPPEVLPPVIQKQDPDADPIMSIVVSRTSASLRTLTEIADKQVKRALESVDGVGAVTINGDRSREIHIVVDVEKLNAHGLSIDQVRERDSAGERRDPRRHARAGQVGGRPAHARPHRRHRSVQRRHRRHASTASRSGSPTSATPRTRSRKWRPRCSCPTAARACSSTSAAHPARTRSRSPKPSSSGSTPSAGRCRRT